MTPTLVLYRGSQVERVVPILGRVARIGSDPGCDLRLESAPPLLATVERQPDRCLLHGRSDHPMRLNRQPVTAGLPCPWPLGGRLRLDRERVIVLMADEVDEPAAPRDRSVAPSQSIPRIGPEDPADAIEAVHPITERFRRRARVELAVTLLLLGLAGWSTWSLARPQPLPIQAAEVPSDGFSTLINEVRSVGEEGRIAAQEFQLALQEGRQGEGARARARLIRLRSWVRQFADADAQFTGRFRPLSRIYQITVKLI